jgi:hypothetical protein
MINTLIKVMIHVLGEHNKNDNKPYLIKKKKQPKLSLTWKFKMIVF